MRDRRAACDLAPISGRQAFDMADLNVKPEKCRRYGQGDVSYVSANLTDFGI